MDLSDHQGAVLLPRVKKPKSKKDQAKILAKARDDYLYFCWAILGLGGGYGMPKFMLEYGWDRALFDEQWIAVAASRDFYKSMHFCIAWVMWNLMFEPSKEIYLFSHSNDLAREKGELIYNSLKENPWYKHMFDPRICFSPMKINVNQNGAIAKVRIKGLSQAARGPHPDIIICDDLLAENSNITLQQMEKQFNSAILGMVDPRRTQVLLIGTYLEEDDLLWKAIHGDGGGWWTTEVPIMDRDTGEPIFPEKYDKEDIAALKAITDPLSFERERLLVPMSEGQSYFPRKMLIRNYDQSIAFTMGQRSGARVMSVDIAVSERDNSDRTVVTVIDKIGEDRFIRWVASPEKNVNIDNLIRYLENLYATMMPHVVAIESTGVQKAIVDHIMLHSRLPIMPVDTNVRTKMEMISDFKMAIEKGWYHIPYANEDEKDYAHTITKQLTGFIRPMRREMGAGYRKSNSRVVSTAKHDDEAMSLIIGEHVIKDFAGSPRDIMVGRVDVSSINKQQEKLTQGGLRL